ncbi:MAG: hypothetical protein JNM07_03840 [Phycisphaerae bacterium]|nr:hypothetical protein [Phycisphaerae bacterium]
MGGLRSAACVASCAVLLTSVLHARIPRPTPPEPGGIADRLSPDDAARRRLTGVDVSRLARASTGDMVRLEIFTDTVFNARVADVVRRPDGVSWRGTLEGESLGTCTVTVRGGLVCAGVWSERGSFGLTPTGDPPIDGRAPVIAEELQPDATARCLMGRSVRGLPEGWSGPAGRIEPARADAPGIARNANRDNRGGSSRDTPCPCADDPATVDVLCVYTTLARNAAGGLAALQTRVQNAADAANDAYTNSGINTGGVNRLRLRIVGYEEVSYNEQSPQWLDHLSRVTETADGYMDNVHALRDQHRADTVLLVVDDTRFTGGAAWWAIWDQALAFSCCNWRGLGGGSLLLAHETGHTFGCAHDHDNDSSAPFSYAWGHFFTVGANTYGTIMAYPGNVRLQYFSNPGLTHAGTGQPLGVPAGQPRAAYNALVIRQTRAVIANYRDNSLLRDCNGNGVDDALDIAGQVSQDTNGNCIPDECEEVRYADAAVPGPGEGLSWSTAGGDLAELFSVAELRCSHVRSIWVADGSYTPDAGSGQRFRSFALRPGLSIYGGFQGRSRPGGGETSPAQRALGAYPSVLTGEIGNPLDPADNSYSVVTGADLGTHARLDGFTVSRGDSDWSGGGLYLNGGSPVIENCLFTDNRSGSGGGVLVDGLSSPTFISCVLRSNTALYGGGGMGVYGGATVVADRCVFDGNTAAWGGAIASNDSILDLRSCRITGNHAAPYNGGAIDMNNVQLSLANSIVAGNTAAGDAGGLWVANSTVANLANCTIHGNAGTYTGGVVGYYATANLANTVLWGNTGGYAQPQDRQVYYFAAGGSVRYARVQGWTGALGGPGNSGANPMLAAPGAGDFSLLPGSACIDAGDNAALPLFFTLDGLGSPRRTDDPATPDTGAGAAPILDIGAAEFQPAAGCAGDYNADTSVDDFDFFDFLNDFNANNSAADVNGDTSVDDFDFFDFLNAFGTPC